MTQVDFWQLSRDPVEKVTALIAARVRSSGERLLVVAADDGQRSQIGDALWAASPEQFLANGDASEPHASRQPILLGSSVEQVNDATHVVLADGDWREEVLDFERAFLLFDDAKTEAARAAWRSLDGRDGIERSFYRQEDGKWVKVA